jgi:hypothetical protein
MTTRSIDPLDALQQMFGDVVVLNTPEAVLADARRAREEALSRGLHASIFKHPSYRGCSNGGVSSRCDEVTIVGTQDRTNGRRSPVQPLPRDSQVVEPTTAAPPAIVVYRQLGTERLVTVEPLDQAGGLYMAGGSFVESSDSRFRALTGFYGAVALHDRTEG